MKKSRSASGTMLDLWRPPHGAGDPRGCLATTYTFFRELFDEQCLARFLEIESEPDREDLPFLLERESKLGGLYAGVLVDERYAGIEHSLRWDVLPVRIPGGIQHAKLSVLAWSHHIRIIAASANLTEPGYRTNHEVAAVVDLTPDNCDADLANEAIAFLLTVLTFVPGASRRPAEVQRAEEFLRRVKRVAAEWQRPRSRRTLRQQFAFTYPAPTKDEGARSALESAVATCRRRGLSPSEVWIASPFFDASGDTVSSVMSFLCRLMAKGRTRRLRLCVPSDGEPNRTKPRLAAPIALLHTPDRSSTRVTVEILPDVDQDRNRRPWHAKLMAFRAPEYVALMIGSSNFTCAGLGVGTRRNTEANLLTVIDREGSGREIGQLDEVWPQTERVVRPEEAEWTGAPTDEDDMDTGAASVPPPGFLLATYRAGDRREIVLRFDPTLVPRDWRIHACGRTTCELLASKAWSEMGAPAMAEVPWEPVMPPEKLLVRWRGHEAFLPLNVEDSRELQPPEQLQQMSADDMLSILAAADPSAAFRVWAKRQQASREDDDDLDSATPTDLDPLRQYDLYATFLHRIRRRASVLAQLRAYVERPVWSRNALEWRLRGLIGIQALAERLVRELASTIGTPDEPLLGIADFLIVLSEVNYQPSDGSLSRAEFTKVFRPFLRNLAGRIEVEIAAHRERASQDVMQFWREVLDRCRA